MGGTLCGRVQPALHGPSVCRLGTWFQNDLRRLWEILYLYIFVYNLSLLGHKVLELEKAPLSRTNTTEYTNF
jgi:hypothetical protein